MALGVVAGALTSGCATTASLATAGLPEVPQGAREEAPRGEAPRELLAQGPAGAAEEGEDEGPSLVPPWAFQQERICETRPVTGRRYPIRQCRTRAEIEADRVAAQIERPQMDRQPTRL